MQPLSFPERTLAIPSSKVIAYNPDTLESRGTTRRQGNLTFQDGANHKLDTTAVATALITHSTPEDHLAGAHHLPLATLADSLPGLLSRVNAATDDLDSSQLWDEYDQALDTVMNAEPQTLSEALAVLRAVVADAQDSDAFADSYLIQQRVFIAALRASALSVN